MVSHHLLPQTLTDLDPENEDTDSNEGILSSESESLQSDDEDGDEDSRAQDSTISSKHVSCDCKDIPMLLFTFLTHRVVDLDPKRNPISALARKMLEETPLVHPIIARDELLVQGIIFRLAFMKLGPECQDPDDPGAEWCRIKVRDRWQDNCLILYGHNRTQLAAGRQGKQQEFLLLRCRRFDFALMLIDREGDTAKRAGVASLVNLSGEDLWTVSKPEVRLIKLR